MSRKIELIGPLPANQRTTQAAIEFPGLTKFIADALKEGKKPEEIIEALSVRYSNQQDVGDALQIAKTLIS